MTRERIVVSCVNLVEGGTLSVAQDALQVLSEHFADKYDLVALVHRRDLFAAERVTYLEFPAVKKSWWRRLQFEYLDCMALSRKLNATLWFALHDMTPRVASERQAVYCHNPAPFYRMSLTEMRMDPIVAVFSVLYRYLYGLNLGRNRFVVVQQQWMREAFLQRYAATGEVVVAHPVAVRADVPAEQEAAHSAGEPWRFFYPALPRVFKNMQVLLQAAAWLEAKTAIPFEVQLTLAGEEHPYARWLFAQYGQLRSVRWLGRLSRAQVFECYRAADCLLFPSKLETWGMPLSEFRSTGKPIFAAHLPYAHETLAGYAPVHFFDPTDGEALGRAMLRWMEGTLVLEGAAPFTPPAPFTENWETLFHLLLQE